MNKSKIQIFHLFSFIVFGTFSCTGDTNQTVPSVFVNFTINVKTDPEFFSLQAQGNAYIIYSHTLGIETLGYDNNGFIIYNASGIEFYAFDCTCPYDLPDQSVAVELYGSGLAKCPKCGTSYVFGSSGLPTLNGPGTLPLREYKVYYTANGDVNVHN